MANHDPNTLNDGDMLVCSMGTTPGTFHSLNQSKQASATENALMVNIPLFGMCKAGANPSVAANIASSAGANAVGQCLPTGLTTWVGCDATQAVTASAVCVCGNGGVIRKA